MQTLDVRPGVVVAWLTTVLGSAAVFTILTYIAPIPQNVTAPQYLDRRHLPQPARRYRVQGRS